MKEIWIDLKDYEGLYQVSNFGRVKSLDHMTKSGRWGPHMRLGKVLSTPIDNNGYKYITLSDGGKGRKKINIHRLVAMCFMDLKDGLVVDHLDGDRGNNHVDNLEMVTMRENINRGLKGEKKSNKSCKYRGVTKSKWGRYIASIRVKGKYIYLGSYGCPVEASEAYKKAVSDLEC